VWQELSDNLASVASLFRSESFYPNLQRFLRNIYSPQLQRLGWDSQPGEEPRTATLRALLIGMLGRAGDAGVAKTAFELLMAHSSGNGLPLAGDLQETVFRCALRHDEAQAFAALLHAYEHSKFPEEQRNALSALGCVSNPKLHSQMLEYTFFSGKVRRQDIMFSLGSLSGSSDYGGLACWQFFTANYDRLYAQLGSGPMWPGCVGLSCRGLRSEDEMKDVEKFFSSHELGSAQRRLTQALEVVQVQIRRRERDRDSLASFLSQYSAT
jgi:cytosol alanyl aminopeptidase